MTGHTKVVQVFITKVVQDSPGNMETDRLHQPSDGIGLDTVGCSVHTSPRHKNQNLCRPSIFLPEGFVLWC